MLIGLCSAIYPVTDLAAAKAWYKSLVAHAPYFDEPFYVGFEVGGFELGLAPDGSPGTAGSHPLWGVADARAAFDTLFELGAQALYEVQEVGGGIKVSAVRDPFGNRLGFIESQHAAGRHPMDAMVEAAAPHEVLLENDKIRVLDTRVTPGDRTPVHAPHWPAALYVLSWSNFVRRDPEGNVIVDSRPVAERPPEGAALWIAPLGPHSAENVGESDLHITAVEVMSKFE
jgi:predicted enzyme related to lactoylglutathione lyase/quercetin dioxygenase-like cupin family protein